MECIQDIKQAVFKSSKGVYFIDIGRHYKGTFKTRTEAEKEVHRILKKRCVEIKRKVLFY